MFVERLTSLIFLLFLSFMGDSVGVGESEFEVLTQSLCGLYVLKFVGRKSMFC